MFDLSYSRNALDHGEDPLEGLRNMVAVVRPDGWVVLEVWPNEGRASNYRGLHQWSFNLVKGRLTLTSREGRVWDVASEVGGNWLVSAGPSLCGRSSKAMLRALRGKGSVRSGE